MLPRTPPKENECTNDHMILTTIDDEVVQPATGAIPKFRGPSEFVPPSGKLAAARRKENELKALMNSGSKHLELLNSTLKEYIEKARVLYDACFEQILNEKGRQQQSDWWKERKIDVYRIEIEVKKYLDWITDKDVRVIDDESRDKVPSVKSKGCASNSNKSSAASARFKLAEKKAAVQAEKCFAERLAKIEEEELKAKNRAEADALKNKQSRRAAEIEKMEIEKNVLEQELTKLDDLASALEDFAEGSPNLSFVDDYEYPGFEVPRNNEDLSRKLRPSTNDITSILNKQNEISQKIIQHQEKAELPKRVIDIFDGTDVTKYYTFINNFKRTIHEKCDHASDRIYYLQQFTSGIARKIVDSCVNMRSSDRAYKEAVKQLDEEFGNEYITSSAYLDKLRKWPNIKNDDGEQLKTLAIYLTTCSNNMETMDDLNQLNNAQEIMGVVRKLPYDLRKRWRDRTVRLIEDRKKVTFDELVSFVKIQAKIINQPLFGDIKDVSYKENKEKEKPKRVMVTKTEIPNVSYESQEQNQKIQNNDQKGVEKICNYCKKPKHDLSYCFFFKKLPYSDKLEFLKRSGQCFSCLETGHLAKGCSKRCTCKVCNKKHPTILHRESESFNRVTDSSKSGEKNDVQKAEKSLTVKTENSRILCAVLPVKIRVSGREEVTTVYAGLDTCSSSSFIDESLLKTLGVEGENRQVTLNTMHETNSQVSTKVVYNLELLDMQERRQDVIPVVYSRKEWPFDTDDVPTPRDVNHEHLQELPYEFINAKIGLLIGMDRSEMLKPLQIIDGPRNTVYATLHHLGWAINGPVRGKSNHLTSNKIKLSNEANDELTEQIRDLYNQDYNDSHVSTKGMSNDDMKWLNIMNNSIKLNDKSQYEIDLPLRENIDLPNNIFQALQAFYSLQRKLLSNDELRQDYCNFMEMMLEKGYMEKIPETEINNGSWYVTHHGVYNKDKAKIRVVFNCSLKYKGISLNDVLYQGPDLTNRLLGVLLRFRQEKIAFIGDIEKMFYRVSVSPKHRDFLRLFWVDGKLDGKPSQYRLTVHLFGATSSPAVSNFALRRTVEDNPTYDEAVKTAVSRNFYVDDFLYSAKDEETATSVMLDVKTLVSNCGFNITQFVSNSEKVTISLHENGFSNDVKTREINVNKDKALGLLWDTKFDTLNFKINSEEKPVTKRGILSSIHGIFDPLGLTGPAIILGKQIFQEACRCDIGWDEEIPHELKERWNSWFKLLPALQDFKIERCMKFSEHSKMELHFFSDGSEIAYGSVAYLRTIQDNGVISCSPVMAKARLTPLNNNIFKTVPRIELNGAKLSITLKEILLEELDYEIDKYYYWTDSSTVLKYLQNDEKRFVRFVANRVAYIRSHSRKQDWRYVPSELNPADYISRGVSPANLQKLTHWKCGPEYLLKSEEHWPTSNDNFKEPDELEEVKSSKKCLTTKETASNNATDKLLESVSSWHKLARRVAWLMRFKAYMRKKATNIGNLSLIEIKAAEINVIKYLQTKRYHSEITAIESNKNIGKKSELRKLNPYLDNDKIMRVEGRLQNCAISDRSKHPIILSHKDYPVQFLLSDVHKMLLHMGRDTMAAHIKQKYWIIGLNSLLKQLLFNCATCRRMNGKPYQQKMAQLPEDRLVADEPAFTKIGIDYFGPFDVTNGRKHEKRYGVIFSCLASRAIHLEMSYSLNTDSFLNAFRRFVSRRGNVKFVRSDNGTNLTAGNKELKLALSEWNQNVIEKWMIQREIQWIFHPPTASHFGGIYEREIRSVRKVINSILREQPLKLNDEMLNTFLCEAESVLNCRPLTETFQESKDNQPLTPNHLLLLHSGATFPPGLFTKRDTYATRRWRQVQYLSDLFWLRWRKEFLPLLQERQKWTNKNYTYKVGDIVLVIDQLLPRNQWPIGRIETVYPDKHGTVRVVQVCLSKYKDSKRGKNNFCSICLDRPVSKLILITKNND